MDIIRQIEAEQAAKIEAKRTLPQFQPGDTVRVQVRVTEGTRTRVQAYEGVCIARAGAGFQENFTVRKISYGEGVERVFPVFSPMVEGVELLAHDGQSFASDPFDRRFGRGGGVLGLRCGDRARAYTPRTGPSAMKDREVFLRILRVLPYRA